MIYDKDGKNCVLKETDEFEKEVKELGSSERFMKFLKERSKQEITHILSVRAAITGQETISYRELFNQIKGLIHSAPPGGPDDYRFHRMLGGGALGVRPYLLTNKAGHAKVIHIIWQDLSVLNMIMVQYILPVVVMKRMVY